MKIIKLFLIMSVMLTGTTMADSGGVPEGSVCCADGVSARDCCESNDFIWCSDKQVCARYSEYCDYLCDDYQRSEQCMCANMTISVSSSNAPDRPYCCSANDDSLQSCCTNMGYTWVGPTKNTGKCSAPEPICVPYFTMDGVSNDVTTFEDTYYEEETELCCDNADSGEACCASFGGFWCEQTQSCYQDQRLPSFMASPCMTSQICESLEKVFFGSTYGNFKYCASNHTCYDPIKYYRTCPDVDKAACLAAREEWNTYAIVWCDSPAKCFNYKAGYTSQCRDPVKVRCENGPSSYAYCSSNDTCYTDLSRFYLNCPLVNETYCKTKLGDTNHWCSINNKCYYSTSTYQRSCK